MQVIEVKKLTKANKSVIWRLWSDVENRTIWDDSLEWATINGLFKLGVTGELKLKDQPVRKFEIIEYSEEAYYTERFFLPMGGIMDWYHSIEKINSYENEVTFKITVSGPTAILLFPIMKIILKKAIPETVDKFILCAEK